MALDNEQKEKTDNANSSPTDWLGVGDSTKSTPETPKKAEGKTMEAHVQEGLKAEDTFSQSDVFGNVIGNVNAEIAKAVTGLKDTSDAAKPNLDNAHYSSSTLQDKINAAKSGQNLGETGSSSISEASSSEEQPLELSSDSSAQESSSDAAMTPSSGLDEVSSDTTSTDPQTSDTTAQT